MKLELDAFKSKVIAYCMDKINAEIALYENEMQASQESANAEEKSSAGDKYETGRAMSQHARDRYAQRLSEKLIERKIISNDLKFYHALNDKDEAVYFLLGPSIGQTLIDGFNVIILSQHSPLGKQLKGKKKGDAIHWNSIHWMIKNIL